MRVYMAYTYSLLPKKGGGIASAIHNIVKHTYKDVEYVLLTAYDENESLEIRELYESKAEIQYIKPERNVLSSAIRYLTKDLGTFDVLHFHNLPFGRDLSLPCKAYLRKRKLVYTHHVGYEQFYQSKLLLGYYHSFLNFFGTLVDKVVANSEFVAKNELASFGSLQNKIILIRNGVDLEAINNTKPLILEGDPSILYVGHLNYCKGIDILLESIRILKSLQIEANFKLHVVGSGIMDEECRRYVANNGLNDSVCFWGSVSESQVFRLMKGANVVVVPSRYDVAPLVLIEAMAAGKPIIATCAGGIPEIFRQGVNGILTKPSSRDIALAVKSFCEGQQPIRKFQINNKELAKQFDWKVLAKFYPKLYCSMR
jgi:glycosyltransferase involved in cell wall biosynthesis